MTNSKSESELKLAATRRGQRLIGWVPYLFCGITVCFMLNVAYYRHESAINSVRSLAIGCEILKDPNCRPVPLFNEAHNSVDFSHVNNLKNISPIPPTPNPIPPVPAPPTVQTTIASAENLEPWQKPGLLTLPDFRWIMNSEDICQKNPDAPAGAKILAVLVRSPRDQFLQRRVIRESWGSLPIYKGWDLRLIFLLGEWDGKPAPTIAKDDEECDSGDCNQNPYEWTLQGLETEQEDFGHLVVGNFPNNFRNSTFKDMMGFKWILNYCPEAEFVIKVDGDRFVDIIRWIDWRSEDLEKVKNGSKVPDLYCHFISGNKPDRNKASHYYAPKEDWPEDYYFDYCHSWGYGITVDLMQKIYSASSERKLFYIDDVYFGALLELVKKKYNWKPEVKEAYNMEQVKIEKYRGICEENGTTHLAKTKEFGAIADVTGGKYEQDLKCLWKKTVKDSGIKI